MISVLGLNFRFENNLDALRKSRGFEVSVSRLQVCTLQVKVTLRLTVSQSVCLGVKPKSWTFDQNFFSPQITVLSFLGAPSLTRGRVCHVSVFVIEVYHSLVYLQQYLH
jgi:hypothetical protein